MHPAWHEILASAVHDVRRVPTNAQPPLVWFIGNFFTKMPKVIGGLEDKE